MKTLFYGVILSSCLLNFSCQINDDDNEYEGSQKNLHNNPNDSGLNIEMGTADDLEYCEGLDSETQCVNQGCELIVNAKIGTIVDGTCTLTSKTPEIICFKRLPGGSSIEESLKTTLVKEISPGEYKALVLSSNPGKVADGWLVCEDPMVSSANCQSDVTCR